MLLIMETHIKFGCLQWNFRLIIKFSKLGVRGGVEIDLFSAIQILAMAGKCLWS